MHDVHRVTVLKTFEYLSHDALDSLKSQSFDRLELVSDFELHVLKLMDDLMPPDEVS